MVPLGRLDLTSDAYLIGTGLVSIMPLLLFAMGARRIPLAYLGLLQYIAPTLQLLIGTFIYNEAFGWQRGVGYGIIWASLIIMGFEGLWQNRRVLAQLNV